MWQTGVHTDWQLKPHCQCCPVLIFFLFLLFSLLVLAPLQEESGEHWDASVHRYVHTGH